MIWRTALLLVLTAPSCHQVHGFWSSWSGAGGESEDASDLVSPIVNREIDVSVQAPWPSSPYNVLCEAHAFLRSWDFLDGVAAVSKIVPLENYPQATEHALAVAKEAGIENPLLKFALTMRASSPTCEMHRGLAATFGPDRTKSAFCVVNGKIVEDVLELPNVDETGLDEMSPQDRDSYLLPEEFPRRTQSKLNSNSNSNSDSNNSAGGVVVLYANLGSPEFATWYEALVAKDWPFVVRHLGSIATDNEEEAKKGEPFTALQGYGVRLDIRNVEYKVFDDRKGDAEDEEASALVNVSALETLAPHFLAGVNLKALGVDIENITSLQADLWKTHEAQGQHFQMIPPTWQRRQLSLQAATAIASSTDQNQLLTLQDVSQNLPSVASTLVHVNVPERITKVAEPMEAVLQGMIQESGGGLWINGRPMIVDRPSFNVFEMIRRFQNEQAELDRLQQTLEPYFVKKGALEQVQAAWSKGDDFAMDSDEVAKGDGGSKHFRINVEKGEKGAVMYLNDIEKDSQYSHWPKEVQRMLMAMQYGMPPSVRRNLFTILAVEDPTDQSANMGKTLAMQLMQGQYPARLAVLIVDDNDITKCEEWVRETQPAEGKACPKSDDSWLDKDTYPSTKELMEMKATARDVHRLHAYVAEHYEGRGELMQAYGQYMSPTIAQNPPTNGKFLSVFDILGIHNEILVGLQFLRERIDPVDLAKALLYVEDDDDSDFSYFKGVRFAVDKGLTTGTSFLNGRPLSEGADQEAGERTSNIFMEEQEEIFGMIMNNEITDTTPRNFYKRLLSGTKTSKPKNVFPRVHPLFSAPAEHIDLKHKFGSDSLMIPKTMEGTAAEKDSVVIVEAVLALDTKKGRTLASNFLEVMDNLPTTIADSSVAVAYRIIPSTKIAAKSSLCPAFATAGRDGTAMAQEALEKYKDLPNPLAESPCFQAPYLERALSSTNFVVANGRVFNIVGSSVDTLDIELLLSTEMDQNIAVTKMLKDYVDADSPYEAIAKTAVFLASAKASSSGRSSPVDKIISFEKQLDIEENPLRFSWNDDCEGEKLKMSVTAVVDPVTETAQRLSPLLQVIRDELKLPLTLVLAPTMVVDGDTKIPISSYYRFVADASAFQGVSNSPAAHFSNLPTDHILTVRMDVPEPWDIQQKKSIQDTDNLRCDLQSGCSDDDAIGKSQSDLEMYEQRHVTSIEYGLNHLLFFGQCYETKPLNPPNGLQLTLSNHDLFEGPESSGQAAEIEIEADGSVKVNQAGTDADEASYYSDTVVMKNVGYWQLRANPGVWDLNILKNSRGTEIFDMVEGSIGRGMVKVTGPNPNNNTKTLIMGDFVTRSSTLLVERKPDFEKANLFSNKQVNTADDDDDTIHVFSLATGHLYERFLKIMMLSVTKRTSSKVKFWLFENFLSPTFKASATAMAQRIGCEVEFVTYKWPEWLREQTEKQRIIWGYKILFLDVLFPLNVKKIIYVDADQVVRGDLKELWDMDLEGAPYGYTPMCQSRETTLGFQFWRSGFWESHLRGKPYHISALYVVDLERFRRTLVGDQLRSTYQQLSADPGSLANLDQDLPNFAQHQVPIFSLPQEWLWCETWCSDETKADSKTIDLCNNPLHKEPKVSMAKRIISGELFDESWVELDGEVEIYENDYFESLEAS